MAAFSSLLEWLVRNLIYLSAISVILVSVSVFTLDYLEPDPLDPEETPQELRKKFVLFGLMLGSGLPSMVHLYSRRLLYIGVSLLVSVVTPFVRWFLAPNGHFRFKLMACVGVHGALTAIYVWLAFLTKETPSQTQEPKFQELKAQEVPAVQQEPKRQEEASSQSAPSISTPSESAKSQNAPV